MGTYLYGVTSKKRNVKGLEKPVFALKYITKPLYDWTGTPDPFTARMIGIYNRKSSMEGQLVAYELFNKNMPVFRIFEYTGSENVFPDTAENLALLSVGYVKRVGKNGLAVATQEEYEDAMQILQEKERKDAIDYNPWDNALVIPPAN